MTILPLNTISDVVAHVVLLLKEHVRQAGRLSIAVPTGKTPLPLYKACARQPAGTFRSVTWFALDEFYGSDIPVNMTFRSVLLTHLMQPCALQDTKLNSLRHDTDNPQVESARYENLMASCGGLDLALLGIGGNGHIAFNEPGIPHDSRTGIRQLSRATLTANQYLFQGIPTPTHGLSMGIGTILEAKTVILMATGPGKADIIGRLNALSEPTPDLPASALLNHPDVRIIVDADAGTQI